MFWCGRSNDLPFGTLHRLPSSSGRHNQDGPGENTFRYPGADLRVAEKTIPQFGMSGIPTRLLSLPEFGSNPGALGAKFYCPMICLPAHRS